MVLQFKYFKLIVYYIVDNSNHKTLSTLHLGYSRIIDEALILDGGFFFLYDKLTATDRDFHYGSEIILNYNIHTIILLYIIVSSRTIQPTAEIIERSVVFFKYLRSLRILLIS